MCKYCDPRVNNMMLTVMTDNDRQCDVFIENKDIVLMTNLGDEQYERETIKIKFCPFCGRLMRAYNEDVLGE